LAAVLLAVGVAVGAWWFKHRVTTVAASIRTIAVLPLQNIDHDAESEFLRFALADEISNALTYAHSLEVRPSASTQKYLSGEADPSRAGRELGVGTVVTGHFLRQNNTVMVTLEAIEVKDDKLIWTGTLSSTVDNLIALRSQMATKVRQELVPALGIGHGSVEASSAPVNREGYNLFMRGIAMPHDGQANKDAIAALEKAVALDPNYAAAWEALGRRYYFDAIYSGGGAAGYQRSNEALRHALAVEPRRVGAAAYLATNEVESGNLDRAYTDARNLVQRRPDSALAHYSLAYVSRYAGLLDEAQSECDKAFVIDPKNFNWRSCSFAFFEQGKSARAMDYLNLDAGSEWSNAVRVSVLMRQQKMAEARQAAQQMPKNSMWMQALIQPCLNKASATDLHRLAEAAETELLPEQDSELKYHQGAILAACGEKQVAFDFLRKAVAENYCAYQALQSDPLLSSVRGDSEFRQILQAADACQQKFKAAQGLSK
jgi:adenylate cyclase